MEEGQIKKVIDAVSLDPSRVKTDSRLVMEGDVFIAVKGPDRDGHTYIKEALEMGAALVVCETAPPGCAAPPGCGGDKFVKTDDSRLAASLIAKKIYGEPASKLAVHGITGTNGKTTTAFLVRGILGSSGRRCGLIGTVHVAVSDDGKVTKSDITTPDVFTLNRLMSEMVKNGMDSLAVELSSHALDQGRALGLELTSAVFTNLTPEHLDYHRTMENYFADKLKIFGLLKKNGTAVYNKDDERASLVEEAVKGREKISFAVKEKADVKAGEIKLRSNGLEFVLSAAGKGKFKVTSSLIGLHNVYNILSAAAALFHTGVPGEEIIKGVADFKTVPGRLERVDSSAPFDLFVDYAHTPDALKKILETARPMTRNRLICVFGCGGNRDRTKRPVMGSLATELSDMVYITSDNPRNEEPRSIMEEIKNGVLGKRNYSIIVDREEAIKEAIKEARKGDIVLIAGKGHEDYQIVGDKKFRFNDRETAEKFLKDSGYELR